jgi:hypothetical protein
VIENLNLILMPIDHEKFQKTKALENNQTTSIATATWLNCSKEKEKSNPGANQNDKFLQSIFDINKDADAGDNVSESVQESSQDLIGTPV